MLDKMGQEITWTHIEHPAAIEFYDPKLAAPYDVLLFYDCYAGRVFTPTSTPGGRQTFVDEVPSKEVQENFAKLLRKGDKGFVFLHHAISSWAHSWPAGVNGSNAYSEVVGGAADWTTPLKNVRGIDYPRSGYAEDVPISVIVEDPNHPVTKGVDLSFDIIDENYLCPMFEDSVHCLTRSTKIPRAEDFRPAQAGHPVGSSMTSWVKTAERSPVVYIQHGHSNHAFTNDNFYKLVLNAIRWSASAEAKTWAHDNAKRIFRND
jgi:type 1 glutamine amidotransferase